MEVDQRQSMNREKKCSAIAIRIQKWYHQPKMPSIITVSGLFIKPVYGSLRTLLKWRLQIPLNMGGGRKDRGYFQCGSQSQRSVSRVKSCWSAVANGHVEMHAVARRKVWTVQHCASVIAFSEHITGAVILIIFFICEISVLPVMFLVFFVGRQCAKCLISGIDTDDKYFIVNMLITFDYVNSLLLVFLFINNTIFTSTKL